jgi:hypothetical protein
MHPFKAAQNRPRHRDDQYHGNGHGQQSRNKNKKELGSSYYAYGKSAAIEFVCDETRKQQINTITMHAASTRPAGERGYDWDNKTIIQLPRNELLDVVAIMLGMIPRGEFDQTGLHSAKSYTVEHQNEKVFFMVMERGKPIRAVGLCPEDTYQVVALFLKQLKNNSPWMTTSEIIDLIEMTVVRMKPEAGENASSGESEATVDGDDLDDDLEEEEDELNFNF